MLGGRGRERGQRAADGGGGSEQAGAGFRGDAACAAFGRGGGVERGGAPVGVVVGWVGGECGVDGRGGMVDVSVEGAEAVEFWDGGQHCCSRRW